MNIEEFPFSGTIVRTIANALGDISETTVYDGKMDVSLNTAIVGSIAQTSDYIVSMPMDKTNYVSLKKNDVITVDMYGDILTLTIDNYIPSQIGGFTIYASRGDW